MAAAAHNPLLGAAENDLFFLKHRRVERHLVPSLPAGLGTRVLRVPNRHRSARADAL
jgi:hypothetical protein